MPRPPLVRRPHVREESVPLSKHCLADRRGRAQGRFDRERLPALDVIEDEALTLFRYRPAYVARNRSIATEDLSTEVIRC